LAKSLEINSIIYLIKKIILAVSLRPCLLADDAAGVSMHPRTQLTALTTRNRVNSAVEEQSYF
jgi:hypothetical protein